MMPLVSAGWDGVAFVLCLVGFFFLLFANAREGRRLLRRPASRRERRVCAVAGGILLLLALWICVQEWRGSFGTVLWFGWLTVAALALVFALGSENGGRKTGDGKASGCAVGKEAPRASRPRHDGNGPSRAFLKRGAVWGAFVLLPCLFLAAAWRAEPWPVLREGAVRGEAGPWAFTLAEAEASAPKVGGSGVVMKEFSLRFADAILPEIRAAYLRARQPRSLKAAGMAFEGNFLRAARIVIPPAFRAEEGIWLTVEGWNGEVHHAAVEVDRVSPALARFLAGKEAARKSGEGWEPTLSCRHAAEEVICRGAVFGSGETRFMDGAVIEVSGENDKTLLSARLNRKGEIRFPRPEGEFHVRMEEGLGKTVELDWRDVAAAGQ
jgi:hypothetical protein